MVMKSRSILLNGPIGKNYLSGVLLLLLFLRPDDAVAQQFVSDNQWVAPPGVATLIPVVGEEFAFIQLVGALVPEWEFNVALTRYYDSPEDESGAYNTGSIYAKHRLSENDDENGGTSIVFGTGYIPSHREVGEVVDAFDSYWGNLTYTMAFREGQVTWDLLPGVIVNVDEGESGETTQGVTYASRVAVYGIIPQSAIVAEVYGTVGEARLDPSYRAGIRWESEKLIISATFNDGLGNSAKGNGVEIGFMYFTDPRFCLRGC